MMALSNIFREPRREITETGVGVVAVALGLIVGSPIIFADYFVALWFQQITGGERQGGCPWFMGMMLIPLIIFVLGLVLSMVASVVHALGEATCAALDRHGIRLRPDRRYATTWWSRRKATP